MQTDKEAAAGTNVPKGGGSVDRLVRNFLMFRWYDDQRKEWTDWEEITGRMLTEKYGHTPEDWKVACQSWIVGGLYEYRIGTRIDVVEWEMSYFANEAVTDAACRRSVD